MGIKKSSLEIRQQKLLEKWYKKHPKKKKKNKKIVRKKHYKTKEEYYKELHDKRWYIKRKHIMELDDFKCRECGSTENLVVHHKDYLDNKKAWEYPDDMLITLCEDCHSKLHGYA
jgi:5-methylcytosine-specific restriction endonuclease McrA